MLGELAFLFKKQKREKCGLLQNDNSTLMVEYGDRIINFNIINDILNNCDTFNNIKLLADLKKMGNVNDVEISHKIWECISRITDKYRNPSAHGTQIMQIKNAEECYKILMETECLLWILLSILKNPNEN